MESSSKIIINIKNLSKMYKLYHRPGDKVLDAFGINHWLFWRKNYYQEFWSLRDINLTVNRGERLGIIGRNGAGKSTLLKIIAGNIAPTEGSVEVGGNIQALMELGTGFHPEFTGFQNIRASLAYQGFTSSQIEEKEKEIIEFAELGEFILQPIKTYSAGMYARLAFSTSTAIEPNILIIDEILGAGDAYFYGKCIERMRGLTDRFGTTVLFVSHDLASVQTLCDRTIWIDRGRLREDGLTLNVVKSYSAMIRKETELRLKARDAKLGNKRVNGWLDDEKLYHSLLFRLIDPTFYKSTDRQKIYRIVLRWGEEELGEIIAGGAQDNDPAQRHFIFDDPNTMNWSKPATNVYGSYREHGAFGGSYGHAPFQFAVPKLYCDPLNDFELIITGEGTGTACLEFFNDKEYVRVGEFSPHGYDNYRFTIPGRQLFPAEDTIDLQAKQEKYDKSTNITHLLEDQVTETTVNDVQSDKASLVQLDQNSEYGTGEIRIEDVCIRDRFGINRRILETNQFYRVVINYRASQPIKQPIFVFCIYLPDGRCASQWFAKTSDFGKDIIDGQGSICFELDNLMLGRGSYIASAAIFKELRPDGIEAESYHLLDRCLHFQINQPFEDRYERGLCQQPYRVIIGE
jgi:lipopolysaccharide transport system ATP-binding protein